MSVRRVKLVALGVGVGAIWLGVAVACAQAQVKGGEPFPVTTEVVIDARGRTVKPEIGLLRRGDKVQLTVANLGAGQTLEIDFRVQGFPTGVKGPFARTQKWRGRYTFSSSEPVTTGPVDTVGEEVWKYDVVVRDQGDTVDLWAVDPVIVVRE